MAALRVISRRTLREFWQENPDSERRLRAWYAETRSAVWNTPQDIKHAYAHASFVGRDRVVFNIGGNRYRLVAHVNYGRGIVYIRFVGTHAQYDRIDVETV